MVSLEIAIVMGAALVAGFVGGVGAMVWRNNAHAAARAAAELARPHQERIQAIHDESLRRTFKGRPGTPTR